MKMGFSLRWICSLGLWCLTSLCLVTASQINRKSSEQGKWTSSISHLPLTETFTLYVGDDNKSATLDTCGNLSHANPQKQHFHGNSFKLPSGCLWSFSKKLKRQFNLATTLWGICHVVLLCVILLPLIHVDVHRHFLCLKINDRWKLITNCKHRDYVDEILCSSKIL